MTLNVEITLKIDDSVWATLFEVSEMLGTITPEETIERLVFQYYNNHNPTSKQGDKSKPSTGENHGAGSREGEQNSPQAPNVSRGDEATSVSLGGSKSESPETLLNHSQHNANDQESDALSFTGIERNSEEIDGFGSQGMTSKTGSSKPETARSEDADNHVQAVNP